jgi:NADH:ubiquinone oxidoreductase subunit E
MIPPAKVYGVVTFYSFFNTKPKGRFKINVCLGTACFVRGSQEILDEFSKLLHISPGETSEDMLFSLDALRCVGACGLAPVALVNEKVYGRIKAADVKRIIEESLETHAHRHAKKEAAFAQTEGGK